MCWTDRYNMHDELNEFEAILNLYNSQICVQTQIPSNRLINYLNLF